MSNFLTVFNNLYLINSGSSIRNFDEELLLGVSKFPNDRIDMESKLLAVFNIEFVFCKSKFA